MKATFNFKVSLDERNVNVCFGMEEGAKDLNIDLVSRLLKIFADVEKKVNAQVDNFFDNFNRPENDVNTENEQTEL